MNLSARYSDTQILRYTDTDCLLFIFSCQFKLFVFGRMDAVRLHLAWMVYRTLGGYFYFEKKLEPSKLLRNLKH